MTIYTDCIDYAERLLSSKPSWEAVTGSDQDSDTQALLEELLDGRPAYRCEIKSGQGWQCLVITEAARRSQYDILIDLRKRGCKLPNGTLCVAGSGDNFHGHRGRAWVGLPGNIHLCVYLSPQQKIECFNNGLTILAAVSALDAIDSVKGLKNVPMIKWVNDILIDGAKVCGVLAHTQTQGEVVTDVVLGIGLNVESSPTIEPTPFVPRTAALRDFVDDPQACNAAIVFERLLQVTERNYRSLLSGGYLEILNRYRRRSLVIGKEVIIASEGAGDEFREMVRGKVIGIGDNLELIMDGAAAPIHQGRLIL